jgi:hypothetical protein
MRRLSLMMSGRLTRLEASAPITNPICTPLVSQTRNGSDSPHVSRSSGVIAVAENQLVIESTSAVHRIPRARQRPAAEITFWLWFAWLLKNDALLTIRLLCQKLRPGSCRPVCRSAQVGSQWDQNSVGDTHIRLSRCLSRRL